MYIPLMSDSSFDLVPTIKSHPVTINYGSSAHDSSVCRQSKGET